MPKDTLKRINISCKNFAKFSQHSQVVLPIFWKFCKIIAKIGLDSFSISYGSDKLCDSKQCAQVKFWSTAFCGSPAALKKTALKKEGIGAE